MMEADHRHTVEPGSVDGPAVRHGPATANRPGPVDYDAELRLYNEVLRRALGVRRHDQVLDVGCGTGQTTREAARMATAGSALGVDLSARMIDRAREFALAEGLRNVTFERADAQVHRFPPKHFDLTISRFGTMFFDDPVAAFANIGRALRPAGRLVMAVWQGHERNQWDLAIRRSLEGFEGPGPVAPQGPGPFSLADPRTVQGIAERALERLRETLTAHESGDGIWFDARAWIVTARRR